MPEESTSGASSVLGRILCITKSNHTIADVINRASGFLPCLEPIVERLYEHEYRSWCERCSQPAIGCDCTACEHCGKYNDGFDDLNQCVCDAHGLDLTDTFVQMHLLVGVHVNAQLPDGVQRNVPDDAQSMTFQMLECLEQGGSCINDSYLRSARRAIESYADSLAAGRVRSPSSIMIGMHTMPSEQGGQYPAQHAHQGGSTTMIDMEACTIALHRHIESDPSVPRQESLTTVMDMESCTIALHRHMVLPIRLSADGDPKAHDSIANYEGSFRKWTSQSFSANANRREGFIFKCHVYRITPDELPGILVIDFWMGASTVRNEECNNCQLLHERLRPAKEISEDYLMPVHMHNGSDDYQKSQQYPMARRVDQTAMCGR